MSPGWLSNQLGVFEYCSSWTYIYRKGRLKKVKDCVKSPLGIYHFKPSHLPTHKASLCQTLRLLSSGQIFTSVDVEIGLNSFPCLTRCHWPHLWKSPTWKFSLLLLLESWRRFQSTEMVWNCFPFNAQQAPTLFKGIIADFRKLCSYLSDITFQTFIILHPSLPLTFWWYFLSFWSFLASKSWKLRCERCCC